MAKLSVLYVDDISLDALRAPPFSDLTMIDWHLVNVLKEAEQALDELLPHFVVINVSLKNGEGMQWLRKVRQGKHFRTPAIALCEGLFASEVDQVRRMGVEDAILKASGNHLIAKKVLTMAEKAGANPIFRYLSNDRTSVPVKTRVECKVLAVSETGICLSSPITFEKPVEMSHYDCDLFKKIGAANPLRLVVIDTVLDPKNPSGTLKRSFCLFKGWKQRDRAQVRSWVQGAKLSRSF